MTPTRFLAIGALLVCTPLALLQATASRIPQAPPAQAPRQTPPRGRSITLGDVTGAEMQDHVFTVTAGQDVVRVIFYRDDIFRIWLGPDGTFTEAQPNPDDAQIVVFKGPAVAVAWRDAGDYYRLDSKACVLRVYKRPLRFALFDRNNVSVVWQESRALTYGPTTTQTLRRGETEHFYGGGMQNGYFSHRDTSINIRLNTRGWGDGTTPNPAPFYMSTAGYGVFRNTMAPGKYDFLAPVAAAHDMPGGWILPNDGYGCGYQDLDNTIAELHKRGFYTGLWTEKGLERIAQEVRVSGSRVMKLDVAWVGRGYQFAFNGMRDAYEGIEKNSNARGFVWTTCAWAGGQRYSTIWSGDQAGNWEYIRFHIPTVIGAGLSAFNAATGDVDGIFGGSAQTYVRDLQWKVFTPAWMIISGWSKQTNLMKQPWLFGDPYTGYNRRYMKLKMRLTPYLYTCSREAYDTGVPTVRAMVLEFPDDAATWSKRTQYQFMSGEWFLVAPVYEDSPIRNDIYLPAGKWIDYWDGTEYFGSTVVNGYAAPLDKLPLFVKAGAIIPMYPEMLHDRDKPKDPVTFDVYPFGKSGFTLYEDDGVTQEYRTGAFARTLIEMDAPKSLDTPGGTIALKVGAAKGQYAGMPASRSYIVDAHIPAKPASVTLADRALPEIAMTGTDRAARDKQRADYAAAAEGWYFDQTDRRGVLHVTIKPQTLAAGWVLKIAQ